MRLLPVTPEHIGILADLAVGVFVDTFGHLYPSEDLAAFLRQSYDPAILAAEVADPCQFWRIAWKGSGDDAAAVGYIHCGPVGLPHPEADPVHHGELKRIYVASPAQGQGLGKQLMDAALAHLSERYGQAPQWIGVWSENHRAQALYGAYGFTCVGAYEFPVGRMRDHELILRRSAAARSPAGNQA